MGIPALNITAGTTLGARIVESAAFFQAGAAELMDAEGSKLAKITAAVSNDYLSVSALTLTTRQIMITMAALSDIQGAIQVKISAGTHLHDSPSW